VALGSNLGDREYNLRRALAMLPMRVVRVSTFIETDAIDSAPGAPQFLNAVAIGYTALAPEEMLSELLKLEARLGRVRRGVRNEPRVIDLDLILHGATRVNTRTLTLPHPRAALRDFVMRPLAEISACAYRALR